MLEREFLIILWVKRLYHRVKEIVKDFIGLFISGIEAHLILLVVDPTLDTELNLASKMSGPLLHLRPNLP